MKKKWAFFRNLVIQFAHAFYYSFPVKLLLNHIRKNQLLLICWLVLFLVITGNLAKPLGANYLFLDPEYLDRVDTLSFTVIGVALGFFTMSFHVTSYILDSFRFNFLGELQLPFLKFTINNSFIPLFFMGLYTYLVADYQLTNEILKPSQVTHYVLGLWLGFLLTIFLVFVYFVWNGKKVFKDIVQRVDERLLRAPVSRANVMHRIEIARKKNIRVKYYLNTRLYPQKVPEISHLLDRQALVSVFDQHQFNLLSVEILIMLVLAIMGLFGELTVFQLPAAASIILLLTVFQMVIGAITWWFREWAFSVGIALLVGVNFLAATDYFKKGSVALGLNYNVPSALYNETQLRLLHNDENRNNDYKHNLQLLRNWRNKFPANEKPTMVFVCTSGGGQRAAMWAMRALQVGDSLTKGMLLNNTVLMTGASGGMIGAAYYRELVLQSLTDSTINPKDAKYLAAISHDHLNSVIFNFLTNDIFLGQRYTAYNNMRYPVDRGFAFEQRLNDNTFGILDKPLYAYRQPEFRAKIPMMLLTPTIINDGRKLYISAQPVSYLARSYREQNNLTDIRWNAEVVGVDFQRLFAEQQADNLRFLSALRMNATFPYVTPNMMLPSQPALEIMDAGIIDNYGVSDALRFLYTFRKWIARNTKRVVILSIRDTEVAGAKENPQDPKKRSLFQQFFRPVEGFYENFSNIQDFHHQERLTFAEGWFQGNLSVLTLAYQPDYLLLEELNEQSFTVNQKTAGEVQRASLSWRLTGKEKRSILQSIHAGENRNALFKLKQWLEE